MYSEIRQNLSCSLPIMYDRYKRTGDLLRSLAILKICSINLFVDNALPGRPQPTQEITAELGTHATTVATI